MSFRWRHRHQHTRVTAIHRSRSFPGPPLLRLEPRYEACVSMRHPMELTPPSQARRPNLPCQDAAKQKVVKRLSLLVAERASSRVREATSTQYVRRPAFVLGHRLKEHPAVWRSSRSPDLYCSSHLHSSPEHRTIARSCRVAVIMIPFPTENILHALIKGNHRQTIC
jgi:hypothetical protein